MYSKTYIYIFIKIETFIRFFIVNNNPKILFNKENISFKLTGSKALNINIFLTLAARA